MSSPQLPVDIMLLLENLDPLQNAFIKPNDLELDASPTLKDLWNTYLHSKNHLANKRKAWTENPRGNVNSPGDVNSYVNENAFKEAIELHTKTLCDPNIKKKFYKGINKKLYKVSCVWSNHINRDLPVGNLCGERGSRRGSPPAGGKKTKSGRSKRSKRK